MDDWGADFVGGLCLTPRTGGGLSMWGHSELGGFEEGDNEEGVRLRKTEKAMRVDVSS